MLLFKKLPTLCVFPIMRHYLKAVFSDTTFIAGSDHLCCQALLPGVLDESSDVILKLNEVISIYK